MSLSEKYCRFSLPLCSFSVFLRKSKKSGKLEIILLDHGLYEHLTSDVKRSLCQFWEAIVLKDQAKMDKYANELNVKGKSKPQSNYNNN